jgi:serine/threonine protein kinase
MARGHYGEVWKAEYHGQPVAFKVFTGSHRLRPESLRQEVLAQYALGRLEGEEGSYFPHIEHFEMEASPPWMRMEFVEGRLLDDLVTDPGFSLEQRLRIAEQILAALAVVHEKGFIHGDLSPSNVLVTGLSVKLIDVGFGAVFGGDADDVVPSTTREDRPLGVASPLYAAPERFQSEFLEGCGKASDVFSFGKVLYRLITGEMPFVIKPVSRKFRALGKEWDDLMFRCLEEDPGDRFGDGAAALGEFRRICRPEVVEGEYKAECPQCGHSTHVPGGWAGERFVCTACQAAVEVLFYDEESAYAATGIVSEEPVRAIPGIEFLDDEEVEGARKFCPSCGAAVDVGAKECPGCSTAVNERAKEIIYDDSEEES